MTYIPRIPALAYLKILMLRAQTGYKRIPPYFQDIACGGSLKYSTENTTIIFSVRVDIIVRETSRG